MALTDTAIIAAKPSKKQRKLFDGVVSFDYSHWSKELEAQVPFSRVKRNCLPWAFILLFHSRRPESGRLKRKNPLPGAKTPQQCPTWSENYRKRTIDNLVKNAFSYIGNRPIAEITPPEVLTILRRLESRGTIATAYAVRGLSYHTRPAHYAGYSGKENPFSTKKTHEGILMCYGHKSADDKAYINSK